MPDVFLAQLQSSYDEVLTEVCDQKNLFCVNPQTDFSRHRKISFRDCLSLLILMGSHALSKEMMDFFGYKAESPSKQAFVQQRYKILPEALIRLHYLFREKCYMLDEKTYNGYRLLSCDGSDINIARNPSDEETFINEGEKGYNAIHVNALFDITNNIVYDLLVQGKKKNEERQALNTMVGRYSSSLPTIFIADRGYESYNVFAHIMTKEQYFIIRLKDIDSNGILHSHNLPDEEFDRIIDTVLTKQHTKKITAADSGYTILSPHTDFDFFDKNNPYYGIRFRVVRFKLSNGQYACVATNLPEKEFSFEQIKELYRYRWCEETAFREIKQIIGLINWHSKKKNGIMQELYARVVLFNFCAVASAHVEILNHKKTKYSQQKIIFSDAVSICREHLLNGGDPNELTILMSRHLAPVRPGRKYPIKKRPSRFKGFNYRPV